MATPRGMFLRFRQPVDCRAAASITDGLDGPGGACVRDNCADGVARAQQAEGRRQKVSEGHRTARGGSGRRAGREILFLRQVRDVKRINRWAAGAQPALAFYIFLSTPFQFNSIQFLEPWHPLLLLLYPFP